MTSQEEKAFAEFLSTRKTGDEVVIAHSFAQDASPSYITASVTKATPTRLWSMGREFDRQDGRGRSDYAYRLVPRIPTTDEVRAEEIRFLLRYHHWQNVPLDALEQIFAILKEAEIQTTNPEATMPPP